MKTPDRCLRPADNIHADNSAVPVYFFTKFMVRSCPVSVCLTGQHASITENVLSICRHSFLSTHIQYP